jgi:hypothetical protein
MEGEPNPIWLRELALERFLMLLGTHVYERVSSCGFAAQGYEIGIAVCRAKE